MKETVMLCEVSKCQSCLQEHEQVECKELENPITIRRMAFTHWGECPITGDPLLLTELDEGLTAVLMGDKEMNKDQAQYRSDRVGFYLFCLLVASWIFIILTLCSTKAHGQGSTLWQSPPVEQAIPHSEMSMVNLNTNSVNNRVNYGQ